MKSRLENLTDKKAQRGQGLVEATLLLLVIAGIFKLVTDQIREREWIAGVTSKPWAVLDGMIQCGRWEPCGRRAKKPGHPATSSQRALTWNPAE